MKRAFLFLSAIVVLATLAAAGCSQAAPVAPTAAAAAPTKAAAPAQPAEPTKAAAPAQPTAVPAPKVNFPEKGKNITLIVTTAPGGGIDVAARVLSPMLEKELGVQVQVVNKAGAASQEGLTALATAKPDGYTLGYTLIPTVIVTYMDAARKAVYNAKSFQPLATQYTNPVTIVVQAGTRYATLKDLVDAAKASPKKLTAATPGKVSTGDVARVVFEKAAGVQFAAVHFDGGAPAMTALLGGKVETSFNVIPEAVAQVKNGTVRVLGTMTDEDSKFLPGVKTVTSQGYKATYANVSGISAPAGTPKEVVGVLSAALSKAINTPEHKSKMEGLGYSIQYLDPDGFAKLWADSEESIKVSMEQAQQ